jgi:hypothetical protein
MPITKEHVVMHDRTTKKAYLIDVAVPTNTTAQPSRSSRNTNLREKLTRIWQLNAVCTVPLVLSTTGIIKKKLHGSLKVPSLRPVCIF